MRAWSLHFVFALLMLSAIPSFARAQDKAPPLTLTIQPVKAEYMVGEPLHLSVTVTSPTRQDSRFSFSGNEYSDQWIAYQSTQMPTGKVIGRSDPVRHQGGVRGSYTTGPDAFRTEVTAHRSVMPRKSGRYRITAWVLINYIGPDKRYTSHRLSGECQVEIVPAKRHTLIEQAEGIYAQFDAKRTAQIAASRNEVQRLRPSLRDALTLSVDYLLACPADIGLPVLERLIAGAGGVAWSSRIAGRMEDYPYSAGAIRLLTHVYHSGESDYTQPNSLRILYRMFYESLPGVQAQIEQMTGDYIAAQLRQQFARGVRPARVQILD
jgi:hypothetical protein